MQRMLNLKDVENVYGRAIDGTVLYRVRITEPTAWQRIQELTSIGSCITWYYLHSDGTGWWLSTGDPAFFVSLEQEIINARRPV